MKRKNFLHFFFFFFFFFFDSGEENIYLITIVSFVSRQILAPFQIICKESCTSSEIWNYGYDFSLETIWQAEKNILLKWKTKKKPLAELINILSCEHILN